MNLVAPVLDVISLEMLMTCFLPGRDRLVPLYLNALDFVLLEKFEDVLRDFMGSVGRGRAGMDGNPNHNWAESVLVLSVGDKSGRINGIASFHSFFHQPTNLETDGAPDPVERGAVDSTKRLRGLVGMFASGLDAWIPV